MAVNNLFIFIYFSLFINILNAQNPLIDYYPPSPVPDRIILNYKDNPATSIGVNWRTAVSVQKGYGQIAKATAGPDFDSIQVVKAERELLVSDLNAAHYYSIQFTGLEPNTLYAYRVGDSTLWSEWSHFRTAADKEAPFSFIYFGDAQNDLKSKWSRTIRQAYSHLPQANIMLHAGDLINIPQRDHEWGEWFYAGGWIYQNIPSIMTPGNHEYRRITPTQSELSTHWKPSFNLPENGPEGLKETCYYIDYQNTRFISINSQAFLNNPQDSAKQVDWLKQILVNNRNKWTVVTMHHPIYSPAWERDNPRLRNALKPLFDQYNIDLVLQGHDHTYARGGNNLPTGSTVIDSTGPVYVVSVSGPKMYVSSLLSWIDRAAMETQLYQIIHINGDSLIYEAFTTIGELYDKFEIIKNNKTGQKQFKDLAPAGVPERLSEQFARKMSDEDWAQWVTNFEAYKARRQAKEQGAATQKGKKRKRG
ncbi:MAG: metallophosphoesterase [Saprospiraceae bacterium]